MGACVIYWVKRMSNYWLKASLCALAKVHEIKEGGTFSAQKYVSDNINLRANRGYYLEIYYEVTYT